MVLLSLTAAGLFSGCATGPRTAGVEADEQPESIQGPSTLIAGARVSDVRSLAMGAARSKGWTIVSATDQKLVLRRPVNTDSPQAVEQGLTSGGTPPEIEVKTVFLQRPDGVNVVANAQLLTQGQAGAAQRIDYTETYRDSLMRSLASLRGAWAAHHGRVARGLPPMSQQGAAAAETAAELNEQRGGAAAGAPQQSPISQTAPTAWGEAAAEPVAAPTPIPAPVKTQVTAPAPVKAPAAAAGTAAAVKTAMPATKAPATPVKPTTAPTAPAAKAAPGTAAKPGTTAAKPPSAPTSTAKPVATATKTPADPAKPAPKTAQAPSPAPAQGGSQIAKAESFAQSRGCKVRPGRSFVHKRDADADFVRVYCVGDPPFLVKCGGGRCKLIE
ncbi:MAG TPA: hypothetical protein VLM84_00650 [Chromatiaceae bacterium]|nr:hypothetical protein [Chromatiaceae bacterium]